MTGWSLYACCHATPAKGAWVAPDGALPLLPRAGPVLQSGLPAPAPYVAAAAHEASHAVAAVALGGHCIRATITGQPHAITILDGVSAQVAVALAGDIGDLAHRHIVRRPFDREVMPFLIRAEAGCAGGCDLCRAARLSVFIAPHGDLGAALAKFRAIEAQTIELMTAPRVRAAVGRVAALLERDGEVSGEAVHRICGDLGIAGSFSITPALNTGEV